MKFLKQILSIIKALFPFRIRSADKSMPVMKDLNEQITQVSRDDSKKWITLPAGEHKIDYNIIIKNNVSLRSEDATTLYLYPDDAEKAAIYFDREKRAYAENVTIEGVTFVLMSPAKAVIQTNRSLRTRIDECIFDANNMADHAAIIGDEEQRGAIGSDVQYSQFVRAKKSALLYVQTGNTHRLYRSAFRRSETGISGEVKNLEIHACQLEDNEGLNIDLQNSQSVTIHHSYFENSGSSIESNDYVYFHNNRNSDGLIDLVNTPFVKANCNRIFGGSLLVGARSAEFVGNRFDSKRVLDALVDLYKGTKSKIENNFVEKEDKQIGGND